MNYVLRRQEKAEPPKERTKINFNVEGKVSFFFFNFIINERLWGGPVISE